MALATNCKNIRGGLKEAVFGADVYRRFSADILKPMISQMSISDSLVMAN